ncbi:MAG: MopE-related protein [Myxococcota bacterium]
MATSWRDASRPAPVWCGWLGFLLLIGACGEGASTSAVLVDLGGGGGCGRACDDGVYCNGLERCRPGSVAADADGCVDGEPPCAADSCDEGADRCVDCADADGDGRRDVACGGDDCDDDDSNRFPGNVEVCDAMDHDEDCDPATFGVRDGDGDGFPDARCCNDDGGTPICGNDCNDASAVVRAGGLEVCDLLDNDCDGTVDEGVTRTFFVDLDGDGVGDDGADADGLPGDTIESCAPPEGYSETGGDCDDTSAAVSPRLVEFCDGGDPPVDEDCDGVANADCACVAGEVREGGCGLPGVCALGVQACDADTGTFGACSILGDVDDRCDGLDGDCDGLVDEGLTIVCYPDDDGDTFAVGGAAPSDQCPIDGRASVGGYPIGFTNQAPLPESFDCDDRDSRVSPLAREVCLDPDAGADEDCDGLIDEGVAVACYADDDGDGYAAAGTLARDRCADSARVLFGECPLAFTDRAPASAADQDCDDTRFDTNPEATEVCDGTVDNDCDGTVDQAPICVCATGTVRSCGSAGFLGACATGIQSCLGSAWTPCSIAAEPAEVACDGIDEDCDGVVDDGLTTTCYRDADLDGFAPAGAATLERCACPSGYVTRAPVGADIDCDDGTSLRFPGATELCNRVDDDCDGTSPLAEDRDGDGFAALGLSTSVCTGGAFPKTDCDDDDADVFPGQPRFFPTPRPDTCPSGFLACPCTGPAGGVDQVCVPGPGPLCPLTSCPDPTPATTSYDYDCSGSNDPPAPSGVGSPCTVGATIDDAERTAGNCGQEVAATVCTSCFPTTSCGPGTGILSCR